MIGRTINIGVHIMGWLLFILLPLLIFSNITNVIANNICRLFYYLVFSALLVLFFYFNYYFAVPRYYFKQKYVAFTGWHLAFLMGVFFSVILISIFVGPCEHPAQEAPLKNLVRGILPRHILVFFVSTLMRVNERLKSIDAQKTKTELQLLRTQINPHFLFNVLNTIYGQAIIKSPYTADSIAKLSDLMRYSLKEANVPMVMLDEEIAYLESYIALQKLRLTDKTNIDFQVIGKTSTWQIPPMLFIPFIENAFKYGVSNEVETNIKIIIRIFDKHIEFWVENPKLPNKPVLESSNQIGIQNVKSRLDLLYGSQYQLNIKDTEANYWVQLKIFT